MVDNVVNLFDKKKSEAKIGTLIVRGVRLKDYEENMELIGNADLTAPLYIAEMEAIRQMYNLLKQAEIK